MALVLLAGALLASCGGGGDSSVAEATYIAVNAATGNDNTGDGVTTPYKTITKALSIAVSGDTVTVAPGTYDNVLGEAFPIVIPSGVKLIGDEANKGNGTTPTLIIGGGNAVSGHSASVVPGNNTTIAGFTITNNSITAGMPEGVVLIHNSVTVRNNRFVDSRIAIFAYGGGDQSLIAGNEIRNNYHTGLGFAGGSGATARVENNVIRSNGIGVEYDSPATSGDLGGGPAGSVGGNVIAGNAQCDLWTNFSGSSTIHAKNNFWDNVLPTQSATEDGSDIVNINGATIITTGAAPAP